MFVDEAHIVVKAGHGGPGRASFYPPPQRGPDGGNGGKGGDVFVIGTTDLTALKQFTVKKKLLGAENGGPGGSNRKFGKDGKDFTITVPVGTFFTNLETGEEFEVTSTENKMRIAKGGLGGRGNYEFKSSRNTTPLYAQPGLYGDEKELKLNLKLIADFGLIGLPNAGKSSLLNELTATNVKIADYPFTTLEPNLGVFNRKILADIPGLIEGASIGKGLGIKFLKHIEKVTVLLHCLSVENEDIKKAYLTVRDELGLYNPNLLNKPEILLLTKTDLLAKKEVEVKLKILKKLNPNLLTVSIHDWDSLEKLKAQISKI